jgi:putative aldouronate transport system permease protein
MPVKAGKSRTSGNTLLKRMSKFTPFYIMAIPGFVYYILFHYWPMYGIRIAFFDYGLLGIKGFIGLENFRELFASPTFYSAFANTLIINLVSILLQLAVALTLSLLLNEIMQLRFKKFVQTVIYLPHFLSWVVVASVFYLVLSPETGAANATLKLLGIESVDFLTSSLWWRPVYWFVVLWRESGWGTIVFLAAISGINPNLYESAEIDGASRLQQALHITMPSIANVVLIVLIMYLSKIFNVFESVFVMYNPLVYDVSDVLGTYVYRKGIVSADYDYATAVGLFRSVVSLVLVLGANWLSKVIRKESIF